MLIQNIGQNPPDTVIRIPCEQCARTLSHGNPLFRMLTEIGNGLPEPVRSQCFCSITIAAPAFPSTIAL